MRILGIISCSLATFFILEGHWMVFQSIAYARMFAANVQTMNVAESAQKTVDGSAPCHMCKSISKAKQNENEQKEKQAIFKLDLKKEFFNPIHSLPRRKTGFLTLAFPFPSDLHADSLHNQPEIRPPRA